MSYIELRDIWYSYPDGTAALQGLSAVIERGKKIAFIGANGSGKSTLFMALMGLCVISKGEYLFRGEPVGGSRGHKRCLIENLGLIFQDPDVQLFAPTVFQDISFGPKNLGIPNDELVARVDRAMEDTGTMHLRNRPVHHLSYGEKKRVAIAGVLAMNPECIILDEPLAWLDRPHEVRMRELLTRLSEQGKTVILSTHSPDFAYSWADHIFVMKGGRVLMHGAPDEVFLNEGLIQEAGLALPHVMRLSEMLLLPQRPRSMDELCALIGEKKCQW